MNQIVLSAKNNYKELNDYLTDNNVNDVFVVCTDSIGFFEISKFLKEISERINITYFKDFLPNPTYDSVVDGVEKFKKSNSKTILAIGGGSALDVAKCIKIFSTMDDSINYLQQEIVPNDIELIAVPTTAGTGSEATRYAVIYYNGEKQSVTSESFIPSVVLFDSSTLKTLPEYQKKATMLDAVSHSVESYWSVNSNDESKEYAIESLRIIMDNYKGYLSNEDEACNNMLKAANLAGKAINITQTTAGHAMCYKLTSLYKVAHGHAAALVNSELLPYMFANIEKCCDDRGAEYLNNTFEELKDILGNENFFRNILKDLDLYDIQVNKEDIELLTNSVNTTRLKNNPVKLEKEDIKEIYNRIFRKIEEEK